MPSIFRFEPTTLAVLSRQMFMSTCSYGAWMFVNVAMPHTHVRLTSCSASFQHPIYIQSLTGVSSTPICTSVKIIKNEVGCRDDTMPKTVETRRHCEED